MGMKSTTLICFDLEAATLVPATDLHGGYVASRRALPAGHVGKPGLLPTRHHLSLLFPHEVAQNQLNYAMTADRSLCW